MKLSLFIRDNLDEIIADWTRFAATLVPAGSTMSRRALQDHSRQILLSVANDMERYETEAQRVSKSKGEEPDTNGSDTAATVHGLLRHHSGFDLAQLVAEFRALRASVLALWQLEETMSASPIAMEEVIRFNESIDQALAQSVDSYSAAVNKSRDIFLAILGHDLRSPLQDVALSGSVLLRASLPDADRIKVGQRITRATKSMSGLVHDLLDYTRARLGSGMSFEKTACDLGQACSEALEGMRIIHPDRHFEQTLAGNLRLDADPRRIDQALSNLLNNAVQHGDPASPITLTALGKDTTIEISVANAGTPIPEDTLQSIFEPLVQALQTDTSVDERSKSSLGLGLFIVREIALGHGGDVKVESSAANGTVFTLSLPRA